MKKNKNKERQKENLQNTNFSSTINQLTQLITLIASLYGIYTFLEYTYYYNFLDYFNIPHQIAGGEAFYYLFWLIVFILTILILLIFVKFYQLFKNKKTEKKDIFCIFLLLVMWIIYMFFIRMNYKKTLVSQIPENIIGILISWFFLKVYKIDQYFFNYVKSPMGLFEQIMFLIIALGAFLIPMIGVIGRYNAFNIMKNAYLQENQIHYITKDNENFVLTFLDDKAVTVPISINSNNIATIDISTFRIINITETEFKKVQLSKIMIKE